MIPPPGGAVNTESSISLPFSGTLNLVPFAPNRRWFRLSLRTPNATGYASISPAKPLRVQSHESRTDAVPAYESLPKQNYTLDVATRPAVVHQPRGTAMNRFAIVRSRLVGLLWMSLVGFSGMTAAAEEGPGITVSEIGVVEAMPDTVELTAMLEGNAELADDAVKKYRDNKRRVVEALNGLKIKGMIVAGSGLAVNSGTPANPMAAFQAGQANQPKIADKVAVQERLTVTLSGIDTMSADNILQSVTRILDVAKDAGGVIGSGPPKSMIEIQLSGAKPGPLATFKLSKTDLPRQQAYEAALKQARAKAERLAQLAGVELGDIVSIRETAPVSKGDTSGGGMSAYLGLLGQASNKQPEYTSVELQNIPVTVSLSVQFGIVKKK